MPGDIMLLEPGSRVSAEIVADANGNVAQRSYGVEAVGENGDNTQVALTSATGTALATVAQMPDEYDSSKDYAANEVIGVGTVLLRHYVDYVPLADSATVGPGDLVVMDAGGELIAYDSANHTPDQVFGAVWTTSPRAERGRAGKVAVARYR